MRKPVTKKKTPSDYQSFAFRIEQAKLDELKKRIERTQDHLNKKLPEGSKKILKNDVIYEALTIGLDRLLQRR